MFQEMRTKLRRRSYKVAAVVALLIAALGTMVYTGFAADIGKALVSRLPSPSLGLGMGAAPQFDGPVSLEERILEADVIARVKLRSISQDVEEITYSGTEEDGEWVEGKVYANSMEFGFDVLEYLKGGGSDELTAIVTDETVPYNTELGARAFGGDLIEIHDTTWDDREAILFLSKPQTLPSTNRSDRYWLGWISLQGGQVQEDAYTISSRVYKKWLPSASVSEIGSQSSAGSSGQREERFLTGAVRTDGEVRMESINILSSPQAYNAALGTGGDSSTITLSQIKNLIVELEEEIAEGDSSDEYRQCVYEKYKWEREFRHRYGTRVVKSRQLSTDHELVSGMPAGTAFGRGTWSNPDPRRLIDDFVAPTDWESWLEGNDAELFQLGNLPVISNARPLPQGEYNYYYNERASKYIPCDAYPEARRTWNIHTVSVSAPAGALHEAFFDPVDIAAAVGADGESGVLQPERFETDEGEIVMERIAWSEGQVDMELSPATDIADHRVDFIALDGSVTLRLAFAAAIELADADDAATFTWGVCEQPWEDGDLLMLRIAEGVPDDGVAATNDQECLAALPGRISAPAADPTSEPTATPEPEPTAGPTSEPELTSEPTATPTPTAEPAATVTPDPSATPTATPTGGASGGI